MGKTKDYYDSHPEAYKRKLATDKKINARDGQKAKRRELGKENYARDKKNGGKAHRNGKDLSHTSSGLRYKKTSSNRGSKSDTKGDRRARG